MDYLNVRPNTEQLRPQNHNNILCPKVPAKINGALWLLHWKGVVGVCFLMWLRLLAPHLLAQRPSVSTWHYPVPDWASKDTLPHYALLLDLTSSCLCRATSLSSLLLSAPWTLKTSVCTSSQCFPWPSHPNQTLPFPHYNTHTQLLDSQHTLNFLFITLFFGIMIINNYNS